MQRYVELAGQLQRVISVVKVRASDHSKDIRFFDVTSDGLVIGHSLTQCVGMLTGRPVLDPAATAQ